MRIIRAKDYSDMSRKAAGIISAQVILKPDSVLGLATGGTPIGTYQRLIEMNKNGDVDFSNCRTVNLDEYAGLGPEDPQSYRSFMNENLFHHINIDMANTYVPDGKNIDSEGECRRYDGILKKMGTVDLQLLGIGVNGHIAFNEPAKSFSKGTQKVTLTQDTIESNKRFFEKAEDVPRYAYSMGIKSIFSAKRILLIAAGKEKAKILCRSFTGEIEPAVPASVLQMHSELIVIADKDAMSELINVAPELVENAH